MSKYGVFSGPYFPAFGLNTERYYLSVFSPNARKYGSEKTPYLDKMSKSKFKIILADFVLEFLLFLLLVLFSCWIWTGLEIIPAVAYKFTRNGF